MIVIIVTKATCHIVLWHCWFGHITCKSRPRYDL